MEYELNHIGVSDGCSPCPGGGFDSRTDESQPVIRVKLTYDLTMVSGVDQNI